MRYMFIVKSSENLAASGPPPAALFEAIEKLGEEMTKQGKMVSFGGLQPTAFGARLRTTKGEIVLTEGPFAESKEVIGGFSIFNFDSMAEAIEHGRQFAELHRIHWPAWEGETEIRLMYGQEDDVQATQIEGSRLLEHAGGVRE